MDDVELARVCAGRWGDHCAVRRRATRSSDRQRSGGVAALDLTLFFVFEVGFVWACMLFAEPVLQALAWPAILAGNLLAAVAMIAMLWRRHGGMTIEP